MKPSHPGHIIVIESTRMCNHNCPNCFSSSARSASPDPAELTTSEICTLILAYLDSLDILNVIWSGGEFLTRPDHRELIQEVTRLGRLNVILTNGKVLSRSYLKSLRDAAGGDLILGIGLDSIDEAVNLDTRNQKPSFILDLLRRCDELGIGYWLNVTVSRRTLPSLERTFDYLAAHKIYFNRVPYAGRGFGGRSFRDLIFTREDMEHAIHPLLRKHPLAYTSFVPFFASPELVRDNTLRDNPAANFLSFGCFIGAAILISRSGGVGYCGLLLDHVEAGNVREAPLTEILWGRDYQEHIDRANLKGKCGRCRYRDTCGGCRSIAYWLTGDYFAEDPTCFFEPQDESTRSELEAYMNEKFLEHLEFTNHNARIVARHALKRRMPAFMAEAAMRIFGVERLLRLKKRYGWSTLSGKTRTRSGPLRRAARRRG